ncbi:MAG: mechanosensitive ion channel family protein [Bdellovibrionales bacterium]|nr:mechanosensitive ion channel family protein [Bdellovibrionales bacterium]
MKKLSIFIFLFCFPLFGSPLTPIKLDHPRDTFESFFEAMNDYKKGVQQGDRLLMDRIQDAIRCLDTSTLNPITRNEEARKAAIYLKETIDRVILLDFSKIPDDRSLQYWRLKDTEIEVVKSEEGRHKGKYLISSDTVERAERFYEKVKNLPFLKNSGMGAELRPPFWQNKLPLWAKNNFLTLANWQWIGLFLCLFVGLIFKALTEFFIVIGKSMTERKKESARHQIILALEKPMGLIVATGFWYISLHLLKIEGVALAILKTFIKITFSVGLVWAVYNLTGVVTIYIERFTEKTKSTLDDHLAPLITKALRIFVLVFGILLSIQNLGFNVMSLMAGLGLGGLAFALAAKDTAANLFGSIMIILDRPFKVGDWINTGSVEGMVEEVGFRSTRIRTFYDSVISIPNSTLANANIDNMGIREFRRTVMNLGVTYDTKPEKVEEFVDRIKKIILENEFTRKDKLHVIFKEYGDFSLNIMVYFFLKVPDWSQELLEKERINMSILKLAENIGVNFAFPTQSIHVESLPAKD